MTDVAVPALAAMLALASIAALHYRDRRWQWWPTSRRPRRRVDEWVDRGPPQRFDEWVDSGPPRGRGRRRGRPESSAGARALVGDLWDDDVAAAVERNPEASAACVRLLGASPASIEDGLVAESLAYAELQVGPEFARWLEERGPAAPQPSPEPVVLERSGDHLTITLNRPECHNAVDVALRDALFDALELVAVDPALTATLQGHGPSFCSGGDLREFGTFPDPATAHAIRLERLPARALAAVADRVTARVHGHGVGAGAELAAFCHHVIADPGTTFRLPEVAMGLVPGQGGTVSIPRRIGAPRTAWLALSGQAIDASVALEWGLVDEVARG